MQQETLTAHLGRPVTIDLCQPCQLFWFDAHESISLTPGATLTLFRIIGQRVARPQPSKGDLAKCPRCRAHLRRVHDMQRTTRFEYLRCPNDHGRLTTFFDFLREKDFIRVLTAQQLADLRQNVQSVNCSNCGAPVDLTKGAACRHCGTPLSMLDLGQAEKLVRQLQSAEHRAEQPVDPALPLELARARREVDEAFAGIRDNSGWFGSDSSSDLIEAGLRVMARWLKGA
jgi:hypothetical protein